MSCLSAASWSWGLGSDTWCVLGLPSTRSTACQGLWNNDQSMRLIAGLPVAQDTHHTGPVAYESHSWDNLQQSMRGAHNMMLAELTTIAFPCWTRAHFWCDLGGWLVVSAPCAGPGALNICHSTARCRHCFHFVLFRDQPRVPGGWDLAWTSLVFVNDDSPQQRDRTTCLDRAIATANVPFRPLFARAACQISSGSTCTQPWCSRPAHGCSRL